jgi:basic amino acid/polyamine antiporter, APA family
MAHEGLKQAISGRGYFALSFGAVVGSGWIIVLGEWFESAGPGGTAVGFIIGGATMALTAVCYGELAARFPTAGAEFLYSRAAFGSRIGFLVGWFLTLYAIATCAFEAVAFGSLTHALLPRISLPVAYHVTTWPVTWDALILGSIATACICAIHLRGTAAAIKVQSAITYVFIGAISVVIVVGMCRGHSANLKPLFAGSTTGSQVAGVVGIFAISAFFLNGWQVALHAIEERSVTTPISSAVRWMLSGILVATAFYVGIAVSAGSAIPWRSLVGKELPAATAFRSLGGAVFANTLVVIALISLLKTWNAIAWMASRLLVAQARDSFLPPFFGVLERTSRTPRNAIVFTTLGTLIGLSAGRAGLAPIVNMASICLALSIVLCLFALVRLRVINPKRPSFSAHTLLIILALFCATAMVGAAVIAPIFRKHGSIPIEWLLLLAWGGLGFIFCTISSRNLRSTGS